MFLGELTHSLDEKGRLILPARFRESLTQAYVCSRMDGCLALWAPAEFEEQAREMNERSKSRNATDRHTARFFFASAQEAAPDRQGRIAIPQNLREFAGLRPHREVVVTGQLDHVEIWDAERWRPAKGAGESVLHGDQEPDPVPAAT